MLLAIIGFLPHASVLLLTLTALLISLSLGSLLISSLSLDLTFTLLELAARFLTVRSLGLSLWFFGSIGISLWVSLSGSL